jgi:hypothetical protein
MLVDITLVNIMFIIRARRAPGIRAPGIPVVVIAVVCSSCSSCFLLLYSRRDRRRDRRRAGHILVVVPVVVPAQAKSEFS